ncbi:hypothetical protein ACFLUJ_04850 [Chloroflexota bacterium]
MTEINTASAAISFARKLEEDSAMFYESLAQRYPENRDTFLLNARENIKFITQFEMVYYSVISDALEGGFGFKINPEEYAVKTEPTKGVSYTRALRETIEMEDRIIKFYSDAAEQSRSLLADVPRTFMQIARKITERKRILESFLSKD